MKTQPITNEEEKQVNKLAQIEHMKTFAVLSYVSEHTTKLLTEYRQYLDRIKLQRIKDLLGGK